MIRGFRGGKAIIFYFLQPDRYGNLILRVKESPPSSTTRYIVEEYFPDFVTTKSFITPSWTGERKTFIWRSHKFDSHTEYSKIDRKSRIINIILKMFGYSEKTHPTIEKIIRMTKGERNSKIDFDIDENAWDYDEPSTIHHGSPEYYTNHPKRKEYTSLIQSERLLTEGKFERDSEPAARKKKLLKPKIKKNITKLKRGCNK